MKRYLGDSVYADFDGYHVVLTTTENRFGPSNEIRLDPDLIEFLVQYIDPICEPETEEL